MLALAPLPADAGIRHGTAVPAGTHLSVGQATRAPLGFYGLCQRVPEVCSVEEATAGIVRDPALTSHSLAQLVRVNSTINQRIRPVADNVQHGRADVWTIDPSFGDCEDYALTKRARLVELGWPAAALRIAVVRDENSNSHAVLIARTGKGDFVLDNRRARVMSWRDVPYRWVKIQSGENPRQWLQLAGYGDEMIERKQQRLRRLKLRIAGASAGTSPSSLGTPIIQLPPN